jgi:glycosyltransferase involved in cell wall biosynthesis
MRILLIIKRFDFGGAENHVLDLANTLSSRGNDVSILAPKGRQMKRLSPDVDFHRMNLNSLFLPLQALIIARLIRKKQIQLIHGHQRMAIYTACLAGIISQTPVVATVHGRTRYDLSTPFARKIPARLIFVSRRVKEVSATLDQIQHKSVVIPNGTPVWEKTYQPIPYHLCYVSRLDTKHAQLIALLIKQVLPALYKSFPDISMLVVGDGNKMAYLKKLANDLHKKTGHELCTFAGYHEDMQPFIAQSSLLIGAGRAALMGLASACPVLSTNSRRGGGLISTGNYDVMKQNNFLDVDAPHPDAAGLINKISAFYACQDFWLDQADELQQKVFHDFGLDKIVSEIEQQYQLALK